MNKPTKYFLEAYVTGTVARHVFVLLEDHMLIMSKLLTENELLKRQLKLLGGDE